MKCKLIVIVLCLFALSTVSQAIPPLPYEFYGNISINGVAAPTGTVIFAKIGEILVGNITTPLEGAYGGAGTFDQRLVVNGGEDQIGEYITFWVNDMQATQRVKLWAGESQRLDLTFEPNAGGSIDASILPSQQQGTVPDIPIVKPTSAPLSAFPLIGVGFLLFLLGKKVYR